MKRDELESSELQQAPWPQVQSLTFGPGKEDDEDADDVDDGDECLRYRRSCRRAVCSQAGQGRLARLDLQRKF